MRRLFALTLCLCLFAGAGCAHQHRPTPAQQAAAERRQILNKIAEDQRRLLGEDLAKATAPTGVTHTFANLFRTLGRIPRNIYDRLNGNTPGRYAREMEMTDAPDTRRAGILKLASFPFARKNPYTTRYAQIAKTPEVDYTVRAAAIRALNRSRDHSATEIFVRYLDDKDWLVRLEAAKALANLPDEKAVPSLIRHATEDENKDVRIACADALRNYRTPETARALINLLPSRDFGIAWQSRQSLIIMTGRDFHYDEAQWLKYFNENPKPFLG